MLVAVVRALVAMLCLSLCFLLAGCQTLGPNGLGVGRGAYNDVIARTSSEQTLGLLVRLRYSDPDALPHSAIRGDSGNTDHTSLNHSSQMTNEQMTLMGTAIMEGC